MAGLLMKDVRLLLGQKKFFVTIIMITVFFLIIGHDPMFAVGYCIMLFAFFTVSTISYDEFNHGLSFLLVLPTSRREYVLEKYLFGLLSGGVACLFMTVLGIIYSRVINEDFVIVEWMAGTVSVLVTLIIFLCLTIPLHLKFGIEKARIVVSFFMMAIFIIMMLALKSDQSIALLKRNFVWIQSLGVVPCCIIGGVLFVLIIAVSIISSIRIMEKKQF